MAIGEKKQILRGMYEGNSAEAVPVEGPPQPGMIAASAESKHADRWMCRVAHAAIYFLILVAGLVIAWTFREHYLAGYNFSPASRVQLYVRDTFRLMGMSIFLILLGIGIFILFRESLPKRFRWITFGLLVGLFPICLTCGFFFPVAYRSGRAAAFANLDLANLEADADAIQSIYNDPEPHTLNSGDTDFARVPSYSTDHLKVQSVEITASGVVLINDGERGRFREESRAGIFVPARPLGDPAGFAEKHHMRILGGTRPVMGFDDDAEMGDLEAPRSTTSWSR